MAISNKEIMNNFNVSKFLAAKSGDKFPDLKFPIGTDRKKDGMRMDIVVRNEKGKALARPRDGKFACDYTEQLQAHIDEILVAVGKDPEMLDDHVWDCEAIAVWRPDDVQYWDSVWGKTQSIMKTGRRHIDGVYTYDGPPKLNERNREYMKKHGYEDWAELLANEIMLHVFDFPSIRVFKKPFVDVTPYFMPPADEIEFVGASRRGKLEFACELLSERGQEMIKPERLFVCHNMEQLDKLYARFLKEGDEGQMLKFLDAPCILNNRGAMGFKRKPDEDVDAVIIDVVRGSGKNSDRGGAYLVRLVLETDKNDKPTKLGDEMKVNMRTDVERVEHFKNKKDIIGHIIELKFQESCPTSKTVKRFAKVKVDQSRKARIRYDLPRIKVKR